LIFFALEEQDTHKIKRGFFLRRTSLVLLCINLITGFIECVETPGQHAGVEYLVKNPSKKEE
jgi:hypothetical protein